MTPPASGPTMGATSAGRATKLMARMSSDLAKVRTPIYLLAARDDELVAPAQLFAVEQSVGAAPHAIRKALAPCNHGGLFMGKTILAEYWPRIAHWMLEPDRRNLAPAAA